MHVLVLSELCQATLQENSLLRRCSLAVLRICDEDAHLNDSGTIASTRGIAQNRLSK